MTGVLLSMESQRVIVSPHSRQLGMELAFSSLLCILCFLCSFLRDHCASVLWLRPSFLIQHLHMHAC